MRVNPKPRVLGEGSLVSEMSAFTQSYRNSRLLFKCHVILFMWGICFLFSLKISMGLSSS